MDSKPLRAGQAPRGGQEEVAGMGRVNHPRQPSAHGPQLLRQLLHILREALQPAEQVQRPTTRRATAASAATPLTHRDVVGSRVQQAEVGRELHQLAEREHQGQDNDVT